MPDTRAAQIQESGAVRFGCLRDGDALEQFVDVAVSGKVEQATDIRRTSRPVSSLISASLGEQRLLRAGKCSSQRSMAD